ncbi:MAG: hypothetical protein KC432_15545, partial [Thermomicrobiales bacterium]|nr:hypothetical protein [Thermomicrobiales bacterium]
LPAVAESRQGAPRSAGYGTGCGALAPQGARQAVPLSQRPAHGPEAQSTQAEPAGNPRASQSASFVQAAQPDGGVTLPQ